ncbi:hypothetical protein BVER_05297 [Candidatus Burkholderia verschuerenii]|uniref:HTH cro/C1-type domain-containing protein n=1 Tax=Candidatus Burkholderia verschuerenii TaxID=242163 RepID=A0A0L0MF17_9BURK|nr:helix-turn-helix transcriptional regulator [Candidatus Burkholderia verschuerenii]KND60928.1 hypothetical protein BVER_05297 [Candidatus Burkholderia verschuerenii]
MHFDLATSDEIAEVIGQRLREHRLAQNLQQSELAARAGVSVRVVSNIERNGQGTFDNLIRVASALGLASHFSALFDLKTRSIKAMEAASTKRERATSTRTRPRTRT